MAAPTQPAPAGEPEAASRLDRIGAFLDRADRLSHAYVPPFVVGLQGAGCVLAALVVGDWRMAITFGGLTAGWLRLWFWVARWLGWWPA